MTENKDPEDILAQSKEQKRHKSEPSEPAQTEDDSPSLEEEIAAVFEQLEAGEVPSNLTMRDDNLAALIRGLENAGELDAVGSDAREYLDKDSVDEENRGSVLRLLVRAGLKEVRPDLPEATKAGYEHHQQNQEVDF